MDKLKSIIDTLKSNKHLTIAIISSIFLIGVIIFILSEIKPSSNSGSDNTSVSTKDYADSESDMTTSDLSTSPDSETTTMLPADSEPVTDEHGNIISDINFTLPNEQNEEPETTLPLNEYPYLIKVNRLLNCVTVYTRDSNDEFTVPYKAMACSTGKYINNTPLGTFRTSSKYTWRLMVDGTHSQYATRIYGGILFHSVPCYRPSKDQLEVAEFNKLGSPASLGCIRLTVEDSKWIYDNCPSGTTVIIYDDADSPGPLGKPEVIKIPEDSPYAGWDPTDPDSNNPWNNCSPVITASDITIRAGSNYNLLSNVSATDTCGNDITSGITVTGTYDINTAGSYPITFSVTDLLGRSASISITLTVAPPAASEIPATTTKPTERNTTDTETSNTETTKKETTSTKETTSKKETTSRQEESTEEATTSPMETDETAETTTDKEPETPETVTDDTNADESASIEENSKKE